ncbi:PASTA domain-containing protein [Kaarinaea lacus]
MLLVERNLSFLVFLVFVFILSACTSGGSGDDSSDKPAQVQIPNLIGASEQEAIQTLSELDLTIITDRTNFNAPIGEVISQAPPSGEFIDVGSEITLTISDGIIVPNVTGMTEADAIQNLTAAGLDFSTNYTNSNALIGEVFNQSIEADSNVNPGTIIDLDISIGVAVPDVIGMNITDATSTLANLGFMVNDNYVTNSSPINTVLNQDHTLGSNLNYGSTITLTISSGINVPSLIGQNVQQATVTLTALGLGVTTNRVNDTATIDNVINQSPVANTNVNAGTTVTLVVSDGVAVPNVINMSETNATTALTDLGFTVTTNYLSNSAPMGQVFNQNPLQGTNLNLGSLISIDVSTGISVSNVVGLSLTDGVIQLSNQGLGTNVTRQLNTAPIDEIIAQDISPGTNVNSGTVIELTVSDGLIVPDVIGRDFTDATNILQDAGFSVNVVQIQDVTQVDGQVFEQSPAANTQTNGTVVVTISVFVNGKVLGPTDCLTDFASLVAQIGLADPAIGGQVYDNWWTASGITAPTSNQPLWETQNTNTRTGADTWRCKECHGWDYAGADGVYGDTTNSHFTGFPGILQAAGDTAINIYCAIHSGTNIDARHNFSSEISTVDILHLTRFITETQSGTTPRGLIDTAIHISPSGTVLGTDSSNGNSLYNNSDVGCALSNCHGPNGDVQHQPLAELALNDPWETLHKIRFGHPGSVPLMPSYSDPNLPASTRLTLAQSKDVVAHAQTLTPTAPNACQSDFALFVSQIGLADATQGGQLYDKWWVAAGVQAPTADHPIWNTRTPSTINTRTGEDTWRCNECHGWDYAGVDGVYGDTTNSHFTGFPGVLAAASNTPIDVFCAIRSGVGINPAHNFTTVMSDTQILHLTKFITTPPSDTMPLGILSVTPYITSTGESNGNSTNGDNLYNGSLGCASTNCHGPNGDVQTEPLGTLALVNPWQTLHKIRFGHPGSIPIMPSYSEFITISQASDVVAFTQTLVGSGGTPPTVGDNSIIAFGGRLFDNWIAETGAATPPIDNPVWALQDTNNRTGVVTWQCTECHGWDYKGVDGIYGDPASSHFTGFGGVLNSQKTEQEIVSFITNGFFHAPTAQMMHVYDGLLTAEQIQALAKFIKQGTVDTDTFFGPDTIINGSFANFQNGENLYSFQGFGVITGACELCHGADGLGEPGVNLGNLSNTDPWRFLHKIRFGQPATAMPSMFEAVDNNGLPIFNIQDSVDIIQYSQSLP